MPPIDMRNKKYHLKHLSMRIPWNDTGWHGVVCNEPRCNDACLILKNCALKRDDVTEGQVAGKLLKDISEDQFPVCKGERGFFMAPFSFSRHISHPYADIPKAKSTHGNLKPTLIQHPAYSAAGVPFRWMFKESAPAYSELYDLDYDEDREPDLNFEKDTWIQEYHNQRAMLDAFFGHIMADSSLVFFYAKQVPFVELYGRVLIGVGRVHEVHKSGTYDGSGNPLDVGYWEHNVLHSIRPDCTDGFLLPYHEALEYAESHHDFNPSEIAVITPPDKLIEFSYATEHVGNDTAIRVLLLCKTSIEKAKERGIGDKHDRIINWIHDRIQELEKIRGDYPGMGAALCAMGIEKGHFVAVELVEKAGEGSDPWDLFGQVCMGEKDILSSGVGAYVSPTQRKMYKDLPKTRRDLIHLLSRMDLSREQALLFFVKEERKEFFDINDADLLKNPYLIYESLRSSLYYEKGLGKNKEKITVEPVSIETIDLALFRKKNKKIFPHDVEFSDPLDERRVRSLIVRELEILRGLGHTLYPEGGLVRSIRRKSLAPSCELSGDYLDTMQDHLKEMLTVIFLKDDERAYQLVELTEFGKIIHDKIEKRIKAQKLTVSVDWSKELISILPEPKNEDEVKALEEKTSALKQLSTSRFSVLLGAAGTGKTTLLSVLTKKLVDLGERILFLAPTGKARVRMQETTRKNVGMDIDARTIAQYLNGFDRFDGGYVLSDEKDENKYGAVVIDESSMLTEEMLGTTLDCLKDASRIILVGDHRQLPPIGAGKPFVDIINHLKKDSVAISELKINFRQRTEDGEMRDDMMLANFFAGDDKVPNADAVFDVLNGKRSSSTLRCIRWSESDDFEKQLKFIISEELGLSGVSDVMGFNAKFGAKFKDSYSYFNRGVSVNKIEDWQILSPVRGKYFGVTAINNTIHKQFRSDAIKQSADYANSIFPYPFGLEQIVYGDKVINVQNHRRYRVWPKDGSLQYIANGELGIVIGMANFKGGKKPNLLNIDFSTQPGFSYTFYQSEFGEEKQASIELAYALTVHKCQGSEFGMVFIVIPDPCFLLSRELLYTALTRQKSKVIIFIQGNRPVEDIVNINNSELEKRLTNLFDVPNILEYNELYLDANLIHQASDGKMLRSKSELVIYEKLLSKGLEPIYEQPLVFNGERRLPDFTIKDSDTGLNYYWEHWGMMHLESYRRRREEKIRWYIDNGIMPYDSNEKGENGILIESFDEPCEVNGVTIGALSVKVIDELINKIF